MKPRCYGTWLSQRLSVVPALAPQEVVGPGLVPQVSQPSLPAPSSIATPSPTANLFQSQPASVVPPSPLAHVSSPSSRSLVFVIPSSGVVPPTGVILPSGFASTTTVISALHATTSAGAVTFFSGGGGDSSFIQ
nr:hypothetical protein Iba_chr12fCG11010 [Ipomoea batatas]